MEAKVSSAIAGLGASYGAPLPFRDTTQSM
nr:MAG TPA: hypothetical protein [Caudoviricetes sp.]